MSFLTVKWLKIILSLHERAKACKGDEHPRLLRMRDSRNSMIQCMTKAADHSCVFSYRFLTCFNPEYAESAEFIPKAETVKFYFNSAKKMKQKWTLLDCGVCQHPIMCTLKKHHRRSPSGWANRLACLLLYQLPKTQTLFFDMLKILHRDQCKLTLKEFYIYLKRVQTCKRRWSGMGDKLNKVSFFSLRLYHIL